MSPQNPEARRKPLSRSSPAPERAAVFAALGDPTRLLLLARLAGGEHLSIAGLTRGSGLTRQAIARHLRVLEQSRIVRCKPRGREHLYSLNPKPLMQLSRYLDLVSRQWDAALARLKSLVED